MDVSGKNSGPTTPVKELKLHRSKSSGISKGSENSDPNFASPESKSSNCVANVKSGKKPQKSAQKNPNFVSPRNKIRERRFVVAKKNKNKEKVDGSNNVACKCKVSGKTQKCVCVAYENLRASQEEFFKTGDNIGENEIKGEEGGGVFSPNYENYEENLGENEVEESEVKSEGGSTNVKRRRDKLLEEARQSVPEPGSGRVMHLVKAFERLLSIQKPKGTNENGDENSGEDGGDKELEDKKVMKWALPGLQPNGAEIQVSSSSFCPSDFFLTSESLGLDSRVCSSLDSNRGSFARSSRNTGGGRRSRRNSLESSGTFGGSKWKRRQHRVTSQKPFKLRTEQRGKSKEEEFKKKIKEMMEEEEKQRIPIAQGLPWTTDEPECLVKPPVKEITKPVDLVLHSDVRAVERAEFDHQVAEKMSLIEQYRMEMERQQKLAEEEEIRRLRKELVPRAQPMPYFDRPFIPRRSEKHPTIPKEPKFHLPQHQHKKIKSCMSWNDMYIEQQ